MESVDAKLLEAAASGDREACKKLVTFIFSVARLYMPAGPEDITQDVFIRIISSIRHGDVDLRDASGDLSAYVRKVTRNMAIDRLRTLSRIHDPEAPNVEGLGHECEVPLDELQDAHLVREALNRMDSKDRLVLLFRYYDDLPYEEIANQLSIQVGTVRSRISRAKGVLREMLMAHARMRGRGKNSSVG